MGGKIEAQTGRSLVDVYEVEGSVVGLDSLETSEIHLRHEMGGTIFSERYSGVIRRLAITGIAQSTAFNGVITDLPATPYRIQALQVYGPDNEVSWTNVAVLARSGQSDRELPIWVWDQAATRGFRIVDDGAAVTTLELFLPNVAGAVPQLTMLGANQPQIVSELAFRGQTAAFGAGTAAITLEVYVTFAQVGGLSSYGLPLPGW